MNVLVYENARAGRAARRPLEIAVSRLVAAGWNVSRSAPGSALELMQAGARPPDVDAVILAGGDGTLSTYVQEFPADGPPIGLLPLGTANVVARDLGLPLDPLAAADLLLEAVPRPVDLGRVTGSGRVPRRFVLSAGAGVVGAAVEGVSGRLKRLIGGAAYGFSFASALARGGDLVLEVDGARLLAGSVIVTVTRHYAGGFVPDETSQPGDGLLDLFILSPGPAAAAGFLWQAASHAAHPRRVHEVVIETASALECDGDPEGRTPCVLAIEAPIRMLGARASA